MNILMIVDRYPPQHHGGVWYTALDLKAAYEELGHRCVVLTSGLRDLEEEKQGVFRLSRSLLVSGLKTNFVLNRFIRQFKINAIHLHQPLAPLFLLWRRFLPVKKVLATFHGNFVEAFREIRPIAVGSTRCHPTVLEYCKKFFTYPLHIVRDFLTYHGADELTAVNETILLELSANYGWLGIRTGAVVPSGVARNPKKPSKKFCGGELHLCAISALRLSKRIHLLILCLPALLSKGLRVRLTIVGGGGGYLNQLQTLSRTVGVLEHVKFTGVTSRRNANDILLDADLFVMPSVREGCSLALLEAMSAGTVVIATKQAATLPGMRDGDTFFEFVADDVVSLSAAIMKAGCNPPLAKQVSERAQYLVETGYSWANMAERYIALFTQRKTG